MLLIYFSLTLRWEQGPLTEIETSATSEDLQILKAKGVQGVIVNYPEDTYSAFNDSKKFINFLQVAKAADVNVIVSLKPGSSSKWFNNSETRSTEYVDYYIWAKSRNGIEPPNNWVSKKCYPV